MENTYTIEIGYSTGNSFGSEDCVENLEITWNDLSVAKENLAMIKEHYEFYKEFYRLHSPPLIDKLLNDNKDKKWFVDNNDKFESCDCIKLFTDTGEVFQMVCFWCGHFESLNSGRIFLNDNDSVIVF